MSRVEILRSWLGRDTLGLEIGPLHAPLASKRDGWRVETLDHADAETLRARHKDSPDVDVNAIEEVDYITDGRRLPEIIGERGRYDWIVASHVGEHIPDLLGFLLDCQALLAPGGRLVLALPDKRQCFDALRPVSTSGNILQAHLESRTRHIAGVGFDYVSRSVDLGGQYAWSEGQNGKLNLQHTLEGAHALYTALATTDEYHDLHGWVFVPSSFRLIVEELNALGLCGLREAGFHSTLGIEFFIALSCEGPGPGLSRQELVLQAAAEELAGLASVLPAELRPPTLSTPSQEARALAAEARVAALESSTVWRLSAPIREFVGATRSLLTRSH